jgi:methylated-DNA-[protein]-cysteine S-methyltransferase
MRRPARGIETKTIDVFTDTIQQLNEYFAGERTEFDLPLEMVGTEFQKSVWQQLQKIPYGATTSYGTLALHLNNPTASRAIGSANGRNPISIIVPCHRVIGADGSLTGYAGGLKRKRYLLDLESPQEHVRLIRSEKALALRA